MHKNARRAFFILFIFIFFAAFGAIIFFYSGYRIDWKHKKIILTGSIAFESKPENAIIILNGKRIIKKTPLIFNHLKPGNYSVVIKKEGYFSFKETLKVEEKTTAQMHPVQLFRKSKPATSLSSIPEEEVVPLPILDLPFSPKGWAWNESRNKLLVFSENEIWIFDTKEQTRNLLLRQGSPILDIVWTGSSYIAYSDSAGIRAIETYPHTEHNHYKLSKLPATHLLFRENILYFTSGETSYSQEIL